MDWGKQYLDVFTKWTDLQVKTGQDWFEAVLKADKFDPGLLLGKTIDAYQTSIQGTLDAEVTGSKIWFEEVAGVKGLPKEAADLVKQVQGVAEQITGAQQSFVDGWFEFVRQIDLAEFPGKLLKEQPVKKAAAAKA